VSEANGINQRQNRLFKGNWPFVVGFAAENRTFAGEIQENSIDST
jgi:hypothetical protein